MLNVFSVFVDVMLVPYYLDILTFIPYLSNNRITNCCIGDSKYCNIVLNLEMHKIAYFVSFLDRYICIIYIQMLFDASYQFVLKVRIAELLGVAGTDVPISEIEKLTPPDQVKKVYIAIFVCIKFDDNIC